MEVIVVTRKYFNYEDSYQIRLGVFKTDKGADAAIEKDKHKADHKLMDQAKYISCKKYFREAINRLIQLEESSPKKTGFLFRYNYDCLNKVAKKSWDELHEKFGGARFSLSLWHEFDKKDEYNLNQILDCDWKTISFDDYQDIQDWYAKDTNYEDPDDIYYVKETFEVQE